MIGDWILIFKRINEWSRGRAQDGGAWDEAGTVKQFSDVSSWLVNPWFGLCSYRNQVTGNQMLRSMRLPLGTSVQRWNLLFDKTCSKNLCLRLCQSQGLSEFELQLLG